MTWQPNPEQQEAIEAKGRVFVSAGAGTGKTAVLVERFAAAVCDEGLDVESVLVITYTKRAAGELRARIREALRDRGIDVDSILVITYTRKAAGELRTRIRAALRERGRPDLARELDGAWISTIHGFCNRLLKAHPFAAGLDPRFRELDDAQGSVVRSEAFGRALARFTEREDADRSVS